MSFVLVAFDNTPEAEKALEHAFLVIEPEDEILVLMIIPEPGSDPFVDTSNELSIHDAEQIVGNIKTKYQFKNIKIKTKVTRGNVVNEIVKASNDEDCKLIVIGFKGISRIGKFRLGSVSGEVAKRASKPLLVVK